MLPDDVGDLERLFAHRADIGDEVLAAVSLTTHDANESTDEFTLQRQIASLCFRVQRAVNSSSAATAQLRRACVDWWHGSVAEPPQSPWLLGQHFATRSLLHLTLLLLLVGALSYYWRMASPTSQGVRSAAPRERKGVSVAKWKDVNEE
jgi:hypothetical protein